MPQLNVDETLARVDAVRNPGAVPMPTPHSLTVEVLAKGAAAVVDSLVHAAQAEERMWTGADGGAQFALDAILLFPPPAVSSSAAEVPADGAPPDTVEAAASEAPEPPYADWGQAVTAGRSSPRLM